MNQLPSVVSKPNKKPEWTYVGTHIGTHVSGLGRISVSEGDSQKKRKKFSKEFKSEEESRDLQLKHSHAFIFIQCANTSM